MAEGTVRDYCYPVRVDEDPDGGVVASFTDVPEAIAHGRDTAAAFVEARQALAVALFGRLKHDGMLPRPSRSSGILIAPGATDTLKIAVCEAWMATGLSKADFARLIGVDEKEARRILDPDAATKADRLEQALNALGRKLHIAVEAA